ncbi:hypothetical protein Ddye_021593 [Dipteronia dyeriana]|uniref:Uncharacterized protein n=1 Tax=Dipteronia dyeriana TaxID=168575 RepID=A0AAD9WXP0_9ROSI|nr:hypothetical protein Ddye_021593 [Dipteronia dyeriana]
MVCHLLQPPSSVRFYSSSIIITSPYIPTILLLRLLLGLIVGNRNTQERFQCYGEMVSRYFDMMLNILYEMVKVMIKPLDPEFRSTPQEILSDSRYMPHFKDCIEAIDGVHIQASISPYDQVPYIGRNEIPTQNVML